jgi:hypothetical protein
VSRRLVSRPAPAPERVAAWKRLQEIQDRMRIGYSGQAPEDLAWAVEWILANWDLGRRNEELQALLEKRDDRISRLESQSGKLLVQNGRLREALNPIETEEREKA